MRGRESKRDSMNKVGDRGRRRSKLPTEEGAHWQGLIQGCIPGPWDHDPSWRQTLNQLSHPGTPKREFLTFHLCTVIQWASGYGDTHVLLILGRKIKICFRAIKESGCFLWPICCCPEALVTYQRYLLLEWTPTCWDSSFSPQMNCHVPLEPGSGISGERSD